MFYKSTMPRAAICTCNPKEHCLSNTAIDNLSSKLFPCSSYIGLSVVQTLSQHKLHKLHLDEQVTSGLKATTVLFNSMHDPPMCALHDGNKNSTSQKRVSSRALTQCCQIGMAPAQPVVALSAMADEEVHVPTFPVWPRCSSRTLTAHRRTS